VTGQVLVLRGDARTPADLRVLIDSGAVKCPRAGGTAGGLAHALLGGVDDD
jgi:hypothetical protein